MIVAGWVQIEFAVFDQIGGKLGDMHHFSGFGIFKFGPGNGIHRLFHKIGGTVHGIHVLVDDTPHVTAFSAQNPFDAQPLGLGIHL